MRTPKRSEPPVVQQFEPVVAALPLEQWTNRDLLRVYFSHLDAAERAAALAQEGELGDRLREAMAEYQKWYAKYGPRIEREYIRREKRRQARLSVKEE